MRNERGGGGRRRNELVNGKYGKRDRNES
jgi:hypothetical protein